MKKIMSLIMLSLLLQGCTKLLLSAANAPKYVFEGEIITNVAYGNLDKQTLDIYLPQTMKNADAETSYPVIVFFHGGRWTTGSKDLYKFVGMRMADLGYITVIPDTRLYPQVKFPVFIQDSAKAVAWVDDNISEYGGTKQLFVMGHSSGAHMGALLIADESYLSAYGKSPNIVAAFAGMAGPYDFEPRATELKDIFGPPSNFHKMVVTHFIDGNEPPMLLMHTAGDKTVHIRNLEKLEAGIKSAGGKLETIIYESGGHTATVSAFTWANPSNLPVADDVNAFFSRQR